MTRPLLATIALLLAAPGVEAQRPDWLDPMVPPLKPQRRFGPDGWEDPPGRTSTPAAPPVDTPLGTPPGFFTGVFRLLVVPCFVFVIALVGALTALTRGRRPVRRRRRRVDYDDDERDDRPRRRSVRPRLAPPGPPALAARVVEVPPPLARPVPPAGPLDVPFV